MKSSSISIVVFGLVNSTTAYDIVQKMILVQQEKYSDNIDTMGECTSVIWGKQIHDEHKFLNNYSERMSGWKGYNPRHVSET